MPILARATDRQQSDWRPVPEGLWHWRVGTEIKVEPDVRFGGYRVIIPMLLTQEEQIRLAQTHGEPPQGVQQSWRVTYRPNLKLGFIRDGAYVSSRLIDFLSAVLGTETGKRFRRWIESGGGPPRPDDKDDQEAELATIATWLQWWTDLEVLGTISHSTDKNGTVWGNFGGPMPLGSLPNQPENEYQSLCRGKFRAMLAEMGIEVPAPPAPPAKSEPKPKTEAKAEPAKRTYEEVFPDDPASRELNKLPF